MVGGKREGRKEREGIATTGRVPFQSRALVNSVGTSGECNRIGKNLRENARRFAARGEMGDGVEGIDSLDKSD